MTELLKQIYEELGGDKGRYLGYSYSLSDTNTLEELLQTPDLWGHDPTDLTYVPAAQNLKNAVQKLVASAQETVDISLLWPFPDGYFLDAIRDGLREAAKTNPNIIVRILNGFAIFHSGGSFEEFMERLAPPRTVPVYIASMQSATASWNHAKLLIVDGKRAMTGGHNLWSNEYCGIGPVHDVSMILSGPAAEIAQNFLNYLWTYITSYSRRSSEPFTDQNALLYWDGKWYRNALPLIRRRKLVGKGTTQVLSVARLGDGIVFRSHDSNASKDARLKAAQLAQRSIKLSQQALDSTIAGYNIWAYDYIKILAEAVAQRNVEVWIVISDAGALDGYHGRGIPATAGKLRNAVALASGKSGDDLNKLLTAKVHIAPLHFYPDKALSPQSDAWKWLLLDGKRVPPGNHAKVYIVDDEIFYVGSDNAYPIHTNPLGLQEFGYIASTGSELWKPIRSYWDSLWAYSKWATFNWYLNI